MDPISELAVVKVISEMFYFSHIMLSAGGKVVMIKRLCCHR